VRVEQVREIRESWNVIATLPGETSPDEWVIVGCHHDAWGYGASDPTAGLICLLESARLWSDAAKVGAGPRRTIKFCCWGAEEFGIIGSSEWVEGNAEELSQKAVAYINLDMAVTGPDFGAAASPSLREVVWDAAAEVPQCNRPDMSVLADWRERQGIKPIAGDAALAVGHMPTPTTLSMPSVGSLGGGSDHVAFLCHIGVPSIALSSGGSPGTAYHTNHDHLAWYRATVGNDYKPAAMVTAVTNGVIERLAWDGRPMMRPEATLREAGRLLVGAMTRAMEAGLIGESDGELVGRVAAAAEASERVESPLERSPRVLVDGMGGAEASMAEMDEDVARVMRLAERAWLDPAGVPGRPWFRNLFAATDEYSGYGAWVLPGVEAALDRKHARLFRAEVERVLERMEAVAEVLRPTP